MNIILIILKHNNDADTPTDTSTSARSFKISIKGNMNSLEMPLNSALWYSQSEKDNILVNPIVYPWDFHYIVQRILREELTEHQYLQMHRYLSQP